MSNFREQSPSPPPLQDVTTEFLRHGVVEFTEYLDTLNKDARVTIRVPVDKAPDFGQLKRWFVKC